MTIDQITYSIIGCFLGSSRMINFNVRWLKNGITRVVNPQWQEPRPPLH